MNDSPRAAELLKAIAAFLDNDLSGEVTGRKRFMVRVAANLSRIVARELALGPDLLRVQLKALAELLGHKAEVADCPEGRRLEMFEELNEQLSRRIAAGEADTEPWRSAVLAYLRTNVAAKLAIDNPGYDLKPRA